MERGRAERRLVVLDIRGWLEGVKGMKPGGKRYLVIPPEMAYRQMPKQNIPANSVLIFEIEFLRIVQ